jgi:hypothetical protein
MGTFTKYLLIALSLSSYIEIRKSYKLRCWRWDNVIVEEGWLILKLTQQTTIAMVLQSLCLCPSNNSSLILPNNNLIFRNNNNSNNSTRLILNQNKSDQKRDFSTSCSSSIKPRRDLLLLGLTSLSLTCLPFSGMYIYISLLHYMVLVVCSS